MRSCTDYLLNEWNGLCPAAVSAFYQLVDTVAVEARETNPSRIENARWDSNLRSG